MNITGIINGRKGVRNIAALLLCVLGTMHVKAQVTQDQMKEIYEEVKTPYKYGMVVAPKDNYHKIDCPTVYREGNKWYMT